jgi:hypothetical protein
MKRELLILLVAAGIGMAIPACKKDDNSTIDSSSVTYDDAGEAITESISSQSGGLVVQSTSAAAVAGNENARLGAKYADQCGIVHDTSFVVTNGSVAGITFSYNFSWNWELSCNPNLLPTQFVFNYAGKASYDAPRMSSDDSAKANVIITGLTSDTSYYLLNQTYTRNGSQVSKIGKQRSFTSTITVTTTDLEVDKSTGKIISGTATASISGAGSGGKSFSYTGTITFKGDNTAVLTLANGNTYNISW